jgi:murein DD-endopeptidase MepM/ murein hydrolase activator NlpD
MQKPFPKMRLWATSFSLITLALSLIAGSLAGLSQAEEKSGSDNHPAVRQGEVFHLQFKVSDEDQIPVKASLAGHNAPFYADDQDSNTVEALLPVSVFQKPGLYPLSVEDRPSGRSCVLYSVRILDGHYRTQNVSVSQSTAGLQPFPGELEAVQALKETHTPIRYWQEPFSSPTPDCQNSPFGVKRYHNGVPTGDYHKGVDLRSPQGRPIWATAGGIVKIATLFRLHGGTVGVDHGQGIASIYIHMSRLNVRGGQHVRQGDILGYVGSTGFATGPHLHWGLFVNGLPVNPNPWLTPRVDLCR